MEKVKQYLPYFFFTLFLLILVFTGIIDREDIESFYSAKNSIEQKYTPSWENELGDQLLLVYIGSSTCGACNVEYLPQLVEDLKIMLEEKSQEYAFSFKVVGVSKDWVVNEGLNHLNKFGQFDEISTGSNWLNSAIIKYVWQDFLGDPATPQLVVVKRKMNNIGTSGRNLYQVTDEEVILRKIGNREIEQWHKLKAPIPSL